LKNFDKKRDITNYMKVVEGSIMGFIWPLTDTAKVMIDTAIEATTLYANKVRMEKKPENTAWVNCHANILKY